MLNKNVRWLKDAFADPAFTEALLTQYYHNKRYSFLFDYCPANEFVATILAYAERPFNPHREPSRSTKPPPVFLNKEDAVKYSFKVAFHYVTAESNRYHSRRKPGSRLRPEMMPLEHGVEVESRPTLTRLEVREFCRKFLFILREIGVANKIDFSLLYSVKLLEIPYSELICDGTRGALRVKVARMWSSLRGSPHFNQLFDDYEHVLRNRRESMQLAQTIERYLRFLVFKINREKRV